MSESDTELQTPETQRFDVYLYDLPKVGDDGKSIPTDPAQTNEFQELAEARRFAAERKNDFDRVVVIQTSGEEQSLVERYRDGEEIVPEIAEA